MIVNYQVIGRSDEEIVKQYKDDASKLSVEELIYGANKLVSDPNEKQQWYQTIAKLFPNDYRALNNQASVAYAEGDYEKAAQLLAKARNINSRAPEVNTNQALLALRDGKLNEAEGLLGQGFGADAYNDVMGAYNVAKGNYQQAAKNLGEAKNNAAALAQILNQDYAAARQTLAGVKNADATTSYLSAVLAARTGDAAAVVSNLRQAFEKDASLKARALNDLEFAKYATAIAGLVK